MPNAHTSDIIGPSLVGGGGGGAVHISDACRGIGSYFRGCLVVSNYTHTLTMMQSNRARRGLELGNVSCH